MKKKKINKANRRQQPAGKSAFRAEIMGVFRENYTKQLNYKQVASRLGISDGESRKQILVMLHELVKLELLEEKSTGKFQLHPSQVAVITGVIDFTKSGSAYVISEQVKEDIFIPSGQTGVSLHGDTVELVITGTHRGQPQGRVERVIERQTNNFVGIIEISADHAFCIVANPRVHVDFFVSKGKLKGATNGQKVIVKFSEWPESRKSPVGEVVDVLGNPGENDVEMHAILAEFGLPYEFPKEVLSAAAAIQTIIQPEDLVNRRDFRGKATFTIDPEDAQDFDDALSLHPLEEGGFEVGVHIADVTHYVKPGSVIDTEAIKRATSVYLVDRVVPMLPEVLSNLVCSLRPNEDKLCVSAVFQVDADGNIKREWFGKTAIQSQKRFTYEEAQRIIEGEEGPFATQIRQLNTWAQKMRANRIKHGALEFSGSEVKFKLDLNGKPIGVYQKVMKDSNHLIEEFMLLANKRIAEYLGKANKGEPPRTSVYRVHDLPDPEKLSILRDFVGRLGYKIKSIKPESAAAALNNLLHQVKGKPEEELIKQLSIRAMAKAVYTTENIGHYGLAFEYYTHFTSPIRRYPDVMVHRLLEDKVMARKAQDARELERKCKHSSAMEKRASDAERASIKYKQVEFMIDKIGQSFSGTISGLARWGLYVEIEETKIEGMIPLQSLTDDVYRFDEKANQIVGSRYKEVFEFGDPVKITVVGADLVQKQLEFKLI